METMWILLLLSTSWHAKAMLIAVSCLGLRLGWGLGLRLELGLGLDLAFGFGLG